jgi:hypothetical protein
MRLACNCRSGSGLLQIRVANNPFSGQSKNKIQPKFNQHPKKFATSTRIAGDLPSAPLE